MFRLFALRGTFQVGGILSPRTDRRPGPSFWWNCAVASDERNRVHRGMVVSLFRLRDERHRGSLVDGMTESLWTTIGCLKPNSLMDAATFSTASSFGRGLC